MNFRDEIKRLAFELYEEENEACDLWSWLPSYKAARACHGDYASEFRPSVADVMGEASAYLAFLAGYDKEKEQKEGLFECPCEECVGPETCKNCDLYADGLMRCKAVEGAPCCYYEKPHSKCPFIRGNGGLLENQNK